MKFILTNELRVNTSLKTSISLYLFFVFIYLLIDIYLKIQFFGGDSVSVFHTINGFEAEFIDPLPFWELLQIVHIDSFFVLLIFLVIFSISLRIHSSFMFYLIGVLAIFIVSSFVTMFFITNTFIAFLWLFLYYSWHVILMVTIFYVLFRLWSKTK